MRSHFLIVGMATAACATPQTTQPRATGVLAISLARASGEAGPMLAVAMTNTSREDVCIRAELLKNPYTYEMHIRLSDHRGKPVALKRSGYLNDLILDPVRIAPGERVEGRYYLNSRFKLPGDGKAMPAGLRGRVEFRYDPCDQSLSQEATSVWQPV